MVAFKNNLPLLEDAHGWSNVFEVGWLRSALERAAEQAGYSEWWVAEDLTNSISFYLQHFHIKGVIAICQLEKVIRVALEEVGYHEVARCFSTPPLAVRISLVQCLHDLPSVDAMGFFHSLAEQIERVRHEEVRHLHFYDLEACVLQLQSQFGVQYAHEHAWHLKIVSYVRASMNTLRWPIDVHCCIS